VAKLACPACWPLYTSALGAVGITFVTPTGYRAPLVAAVLGVALGTLAVRGRKRRDYRPLAAGTVGAAALAAGELGVSSEPLAVAGVVLLVGASIWAAWPAAGRQPACEACVTDLGTTLQNGRS
jgi:mercuric ion transport protein